MTTLLELVEADGRRVEEGLAYNALVQSWPEIARLAQEAPAPAAATAGTGDMFDDSVPAR